MVALQVFLEEPLDLTRLAGVEIRAVAHAVARIRLPVAEEPPRMPAGATLGAGPVTAVAGSPDRAEQVEIALPMQTGRTGADGSVQLVWDERAGSPATTAWDQLGALVVGGGSRFFRFSVGASLGQLVLPILDLPATADRGELVAQVAAVDLATAIVGHVTETTARLWFRFHPGEVPPGHRLHCQTRLPVALRRQPPLADQAVVIDARWDHTAVVDVTGLAADSAYAYDLLLDGPSGQRWRLTGGEFRTAPTATTEAVRIAFASCHRSHPAAMERWRAMAAFHPDVTMLIGDQIYGDGIRPPAAARTADPTDDWFRAYARGYVWAWSHRPVRDVLRRRATYMMADDHDVDDDWGVTFGRTNPTAEQPLSRVDGAVRAYHAFQQAHNPPGRSVAEDWTVPLDYGFDWGPVAAYVLDLRTQRGISRRSPVLGADQITRFQDWASGAARRSEVVVLTAPVPLAFVDTPALAEKLKAIKALAGGAASLGAFVGGAVGGPAGAVVGWGIGAVVGASIDNDIEMTDGRITEPDLADHWSDPAHRGDLGVVLDALFDLANEALRPRAVVIIGGDVHLGAIHEIRSSAPAHRQHPILYQFTSSPIGANPAASLLGHLDKADWVEAFDPDEWFELCTTATGTYHARIVGGLAGLLPVRNFGTLVVNRDRTGDTVEIRGSIRGAHRPPVAGLPPLTETLELALTFELGRVIPARPARPVVVPIRRRTRPG